MANIAADILHVDLSNNKIWARKGDQGEDVKVHRGQRHQCRVALEKHQARDRSFFTGKCYHFRYWAAYGDYCPLHRQNIGYLLKPRQRISI